jgi:FMN phosphatase YigB (HAD superfamily)
MSSTGIDVVTFDADFTLARHRIAPLPNLSGDAAVAVATLPEVSGMWRTDAAARAGMAARYRAHLGALGVSASAWLVEMLVADYFDPRNWLPYAEVGAALSDLHQVGVPLGVVADWVSQLGDLLVAVGIRRSFDFVLSSSAIGATKADGGLYRLAVKAAGVPAGRVLHVGDDLELDVAAARRRGLQAVLVDRSGLNGIPDLRHVVELIGV